MYAVSPPPPAPPRPPRPPRSPPAAPPGPPAAGGPPAWPPACPPRRCCPGIRRSSSRCGCSSELQSALTRAVGERGDAAVVLAAAAVEHDRCDALLLRALRDEGADLTGEGALVALLVRAQLESRRTHQGVTGEV